MRKHGGTPLEMLHAQDHVEVLIRFAKVGKVRTVDGSDEFLAEDFQHQSKALGYPVRGHNHGLVEDKAYTESALPIRSGYHQCLARCYLTLSARRLLTAQPAQTSTAGAASAVATLEAKTRKGLS